MKTSATLVASATEPDTASFWSDMRALPLLERSLVWVSMVLMAFLFIQSLFILPLILVKFGYGYYQ